MPNAPPIHNAKPRTVSRWNHDKTAHQRGYGAAWQHLREAILRREPLCRVCDQAGRTTIATQVDHILGKARGGTDDESNLQPICSACHNAKTATERAR
jgi:5-methylcytosine-specific restriction enzyme A